MSMTTWPFGNHPSKIERYLAFWRRTAVARPMVGFTFRGWFPLEEYAATRAWQAADYLTPDMVVPADFMEDEEGLLREGELVDDDILRGDCPASLVIPWLSAILGCRLRILPGNILGEERLLPWEELERISLDRENPWFKKYVEFAGALVERSAGRFPVSHGAMHAPSDLLGELRGHTQSILDLMEEPEKASAALWRFGDIFQEITKEIWRRLPLFHGGYFDGQYQLWSPGPIIRMQEDASALYSPSLYRRFLQPIDRMLAGSFANSFIHLHSTSMFLLQGFLEIEELRCFEINKDVSGPPLAQMVPYFQMVQKADRSLIIRGSFPPDEIRLLLDSLDPRGLYLLIIISDMEEVEDLRPLLGM